MRNLKKCKIKERERELLLCMEDNLFVNMQHIINVDMQVSIIIYLVFVCTLFQEL